MMIVSNEKPHVDGKKTRCRHCRQRVLLVWYGLSSLRFSSRTDRKGYHHRQGIVSESLETTYRCRTIREYESDRRDESRPRKMLRSRSVKIRHERQRGSRDKKASDGSACVFDRSGDRENCGCCFINSQRSGSSLREAHSYLNPDFPSWIGKAVGRGIREECRARLKSHEKNGKKMLDCWAGGVRLRRRNFACWRKSFD